MNFHTAVFAAIAFASVLVWGLVSLRFKDRLHFVMAFSAGVLLWIVAFNLLPEVFELAHEGWYEASHAMLALVWGFLAFHFLEKSVLIHHNHESDYAHHHHPHVGAASSFAIIGHSFVDGIGIGLGFQIDPAVGFAVALAVIAHGFTDGMNTVTFMLTHKNTAKRTKKFLLANAVAPLAGALSTLLFTLPEYGLFLYLGIFSGIILYIGASDILPEAHSKESSYRMIALTASGAAFSYFAVNLITHHH